jgi:hypothetical protein
MRERVVSRATAASPAPAAEGAYRVGDVVRIVILAVVVLFLVLWVRAVIDVLRRRDLSGGAKAAWAIIMLILPFLGLLIYTLLRPADSQIAQRARR